MNNLSIFGIMLAVILVFSAVTYLYIGGERDDTYEQQLQDFKLKVREDLKKYEMIKRIRSEDGENRGLLEPKINFTKPDRLSHYQTFVTPNHPAVTNYIQSNDFTSISDAYNAAVQWTWVSDNTLHNKNEWWLKPKVFIEDTPNKTLFPQNPVDDMASDCESQAYTLVSIIEGMGFSKDNVRVVVGNVSFSGESSGHAWVQIYQNGNWYELEATSGPYWDDDTNTLVSSSGVGINYFKTRPYPVEEYWAFFNDIYYYNPDNGIKSSNLPNHWLTTEKHFSLSELKDANQN